MGVDIYLKSVWEPFTKNYDPRIESLDDGMERMFAECAASGGYFRNGYNAGDVMWAMGLSWRNTVGPMLGEKNQLSVARARELVALIEERPLTRERVAQHIFENMTDGVHQHPLTGWLQNAMAEAVAEADDEPTPRAEPPDFELLLAFLTKRREQLLTLLRKSIELNEPLIVSM